MQLIDGYLYHIKDECFDLLNDSSLMLNKDNSRPTYFVIKEEKTDLLWFIPLSKKVEKYERIVKQKVEKYGRCNTILIAEIGGEKSAILIQNAFPTIEKFIANVHIKNGKPLKVIESLKKEILENFEKTMILWEKVDKNVFFSDVDNNRKIMLAELEKDNS